jgi:PAS domain S-box-containing protein
MRPRTASAPYQTPPPRLAEGDEALELLLDTASAAWWRWRGEGNHLSGSSSLAALRGIAPTSLPQLLAQVHRDDRQRVQEAITAPQPVARRLEYRVVGVDGSTRWMLGSIRAIVDEDGEAVLGVEIDIDAQKRAQGALQSNADAATKANHDKDKFVYICSHDLREPLRMVSGFLGLLERRAQGLDQRAREYLALATDGAVRLNGMLDDLLAYSRCGRSRQPTAVPLGDAFAQAQSELVSEIASCAAVIEAGPLPAVHADPTQLRFLLRELIANAIRFRRGPAPRIAVTAERTEREVVVAVADDGVGIAPADRERVFEVFNRLHLREAYPGNGIGLSLCAKIAEQHRGRIWIEAPADGAPGTVVKVALPEG